MPDRPQQAVAGGLVQSCTVRIGNSVLFPLLPFSSLPPMSSSRRSSLNSLSSSDHGSPSSPLLRDTLSNATLIFVQDDDDSDDEPSTAPLDFSSDDDLADDFGSHLDRIRTSSVPPLSPSLILLYLLTPFLKLGSMFIPYTGTPLNRSIPVLLAFALFAACSRHLCYMLAKYVHNPDLEKIVLDAFARGRGKERRRVFLRSLVRIGTGLLRVLLATVYLRGEDLFRGHAYPNNILLCFDKHRLMHCCLFPPLRCHYPPG